MSNAATIEGVVVKKDCDEKTNLFIYKIRTSFGDVLCGSHDGTVDERDVVTASGVFKIDGGVFKMFTRYIRIDKTERVSAGQRIMDRMRRLDDKFFGKKE